MPVLRYIASITKPAGAKVEQQKEFDIQKMVAETTILTITNPTLRDLNLNHPLLVAGFKKQIRQNTDGDLIFPHWNENGMCGLVITNQQATRMFYRDSGLWYAKSNSHVSQMVITSTTTESLAYSMSNASEFSKSLFISPNGHDMSSKQAILLRQAVRKIQQRNPNPTVILATTNDEAGNWLADQVHDNIPSGIVKERRMPDNHTTWCALANALMANHSRGIAH